MGHPERTFEHVMARGLHRGRGRGLPDAGRRAAEPARLARASWRRRMPAPGRAGGARHSGARRRARSPGAGTGSTTCWPLGKAESDELVRRRGRAQRYDGLVPARWSARARPCRPAPPPGPGDAAGTAGASLEREPPVRWTEARRGAFAARRILEDARGACAAAATAIQLPDAQAEAALLIGADRLLEQIDAYLEALAGLRALARPSAGTRGGIVPVRFSPRLPRGRCCGLRSMLTIVLAGLFCWARAGPR